MIRLRPGHRIHGVQIRCCCCGYDCYSNGAGRCPCCRATDGTPQTWEVARVLP